MVVLRSTDSVCRLYFSSSLTRLFLGVEVDTAEVLSAPCMSSCLVIIIGRRTLSEAKIKFFSLYNLLTICTG